MKYIPLLAGYLLLTPLLLSAEPVAPTVISDVGSVISPSEDCRISGNAERLTIAVPAGDHNLVTDLNRMNAPRVLREVSGDFTVQVKVSGTYPQDTSTDVRGRRPFQGAGFLLWVDSNTYIRLERAQVKVEADGKTQHFVYPSWEYWLEGKPLRLASGADGLFSGSSSMLRLSRTGNKVTAAVSEDGTTWRELDPLMVRLPEKIQVGVVAVQNTDSQFDATFEDFKLTPLRKEIE